MKKKTSEKKKKNTQAEKLYYAVMIICYLYLGFACMYKYIKYASLDKCVLELMLILTLSLIIEYVHVINNNGKNLRKKLSKKKEKGDRLKRYVGECLLLSLIITSIIFVAISSNRMYINFYDFALNTYGNVAIIIILMTLIVFFDLFIISLIINYTVSEKLIEKQQK